MKSLNDYLLESVNDIINDVSYILNGDAIDKFEKWVNTYKVNNVCIYYSAEQIKDVLKISNDEFIKGLKLPSKYEIKILDDDDFNQKATKYWSSNKDNTVERTQVAYSKSYFYYREDAGVDVLIQKIK